MGANDKHWCGCFESHASFQTYYGVAYVAVAPYCVGCAYFFDFLYGFYLVVVFYSVYRYDFSLFESYFQFARFALCGMFQVSALGQSLVAVEYFASAD